MLGLIPKVAIQALRQKLTAEQVDKILIQSGYDPAASFRMGKVYEDDGWQRFMQASQDIGEMSREQFLRMVSQEFIEDAEKRWAPWFRMASNSFDFLRMQPLIHSSFVSGVSSPEERTRVEDKFRLVEDGNRLKVTYRSENRLCDFYMILAQTFVARFGDDVEFVKTSCQSRGDDACRIDMIFHRLQHPSKPDLLRTQWAPSAPASMK